MTVRLTVQRAEWEAHVHDVAAQYGHGLVAVVKGNGYGFGRAPLHEMVLAAGARLVCVGSVHELDDVPAGLTPVVLTPTLLAPPDTRPILTVGNVRHVRALDGWRGRVIVKLASSMRRYGAEPVDLAALLRAVADAELDIEAFGIHLPLAGGDDERVAEIEAWLPLLPDGIPLWASHLTPATFVALRAAHPEREMFVRVGTALWHGIPRGPFLRLDADVLESRPVLAGDTAGYRHAAVPHDGTLLAIGAGAATGVAPLDDADPARRSPFHFARHRLALLEAPHMHTSLVVVPNGQPCPEVGDRVDVQRPLISTFVDEVVWV